jgi:crotonobetainyl-CoA:carnitine CoA-transferase CaiB-like acyl-CoA transferase
VHDAPPLLGQHTREVLEALGLTADQIEEVLGDDRR